MKFHLFFFFLASLFYVLKKRKKNLVCWHECSRNPLDLLARLLRYSSWLKFKNETFQDVESHFEVLHFCSILYTQIEKKKENKLVPILMSYVNTRSYINSKREWEKEQRKIYFPSLKSEIRYENSWRGNFFSLLKIFIH